MTNEAQRLESEVKFHDEWANSVDVSKLDVIHVNEAETSPELRYITATYAPWTGKKVLDVGCGLGEAGVYFAIKGADVTSLDLSPGMLKVAERLAAKYSVKVTPHLASAENMGLSPEQKFDVIYLGNLFHHVDIEKCILQLKDHLKPDGVMVSWDPVAYNPLINVYRWMATENRTPDEHPLRLRDLKIFEKHFASVKTRWFWLTSLVVFVLMFVLERRHPNQDKFWKKVIDDSEKWKPIYRPLAALDKVLLTIFPFLKPLCWNVVIEARGTRKDR